MLRVRSSNIHSIGYDEDDAILVIQFLDGSIYQYFDVSFDVYQDMVMAPSKGKFLWREIRDVFEYERVR